MNEERQKESRTGVDSKTALERLVSGAVKFREKIMNVLSTLEPSSDIAAKFHSRVIRIGFPSAAIGLSGIALHYLGAPGFITHTMIAAGAFGAYIPHTLTTPEYTLSIAEKINEQSKEVKPF